MHRDHFQHIVEVKPVLLLSNDNKNSARSHSKNNYALVIIMCMNITQSLISLLLHLKIV